MLAQGDGDRLAGDVALLATPFEKRPECLPVAVPTGGRMQRAVELVEMRTDHNRRNGRDGQVGDLVNERRQALPNIIAMA